MPISPVLKSKERALRKRTMIDLDVHGFATASEQEPLAARADGVSKLCAWLGCEAAAQKLDKPKGWISKMRRIDNAVKSRSVAGKLILQGEVQDVEIAYYASLIESKSGKKVCEIADNINNETRHTVKRAWEELR